MIGLQKYIEVVRVRVEVEVGRPRKMCEAWQRHAQAQAGMGSEHRYVEELILA